jgi:hypothetical protein
MNMSVLGRHWRTLVLVSISAMVLSGAQFGCHKHPTSTTSPAPPPSKFEQVQLPDCKTIIISPGSTNRLPSVNVPACTIKDKTISWQCPDCSGQPWTVAFADNGLFPGGGIFNAKHDHDVLKVGIAGPKPIVATYSVVTNSGRIDAHIIPYSGPPTTVPFERCEKITIDPSSSPPKVNPPACAAYQHDQIQWACTCGAGTWEVLFDRNNLSVDRNGNVYVLANSAIFRNGTTIFDSDTSQGELVFQPPKGPTVVKYEVSTPSGPIDPHIVPMGP